MAFSLRIGCTGNNHRFVRVDITNNWGSLSGGAPRPMSVMFVGDQSHSRGQNRIITAAASLRITPAMAVTRFEKNFLSSDMESLSTSDRAEEGKDAAHTIDRLERWMMDSVEEIVKNLREAPLLVQVFPKGSSDGQNINYSQITTSTGTLVTMKRAMEENWPMAKEEWRQGLIPLPEGLILVKELTGDVQTETERTEGKEKATKVWGLMVQGRRGGCGPICYLLKTTRVAGDPMGPYCTHFCLTRVTDLIETLESQFKKVWRIF